MENKDLKTMPGYFEGVKKLTTRTGISVKESYGPNDFKESSFDYENDLGDPGKYPYTRGLFRNMYRGRLWTRRGLVGFGTPKQTNERLKFQMDHGLTGLSIARDNPTLLCIDSDHPLAKHDVGKAGVPFCSLKDIEIIADGINLEQVSTLILAASWSSPPAFCEFLALAENRGYDIRKMRGTISNYSLSPVVFHPGSMTVYPVYFLLKLSTDVIEFCAKEMPLWYTGVADGYNLRECGISAAEEIGFTLAMAMAEIEPSLKRGLNIDQIAPRRTFFMSADIDIFEEAAKFRAMRRMWARIMKDRYGAKDPKSMQYHVAAQTAGSSLVAQEPINNIVRVSYEALAAVLGGVQSLNLCGYDEPVALPSELSHRIEQRTAEILAYETGVTIVADPLGGSYYIEWLTDKLEDEATKILQDIDSKGGWLGVIESGQMQNRLEEARLEYDRRVQSGELPVVARNIYPTEEATSIIPGGVQEISVDLVQKHIASVKELKKTRDLNKTREAIRYLFKRASLGENENLIRPMVEAFKAYATIGEVMGTIRVACGLSFDPFNIVESPFIDEYK